MGKASCKKNAVAVFLEMIRGLFKNYVDFCCRVKTNRYPVMKFI